MLNASDARSATEQAIADSKRRHEEAIQRMWERYFPHIDSAISAAIKDLKFKVDVRTSCKHSEKPILEEMLSRYVESAGYKTTVWLSCGVCYVITIEW